MIVDNFYLYGKPIQIKRTRTGKLVVLIDGTRIKGREFPDLDTARSAAEDIASSMAVKVAAPAYAMTPIERKRINGYYNRNNDWRWAQPLQPKHIAEQFDLSLGDHQISKEELQEQLKQRNREKELIVQELRQGEELK
jgi:hypothetical protein